MIKNFEDYTRVQSFGNGFSQWKKGDLNHSPRLLIDDTGLTRSLVRSAFIADPQEYGELFTKQDAKRMGLKH